MYYIYMDNYRGFSQTLLPLGSASFLVGENSTGKTSVLSLLMAFSDSGFWVGGGFAAVPDVDLGGFRDIVSVCNTAKSRFTVGALYKSRNSPEDDPAGGWAFKLMTFQDRENIPAISRYAWFSGDTLVRLAVGQKTVHYRREAVTVPEPSAKGVGELLREIAASPSNSTKGYKRMPRDMSSGRGILPLALYLAGTEKETRIRLDAALGVDQPMADRLVSLAPIRAKPKRIYPGTAVPATTEGDHMPHVIRTVFSGVTEKTGTVELLQEFGESSGLFKSVRAKAFGNAAYAPYEVEVELWDTPLNITNVGYGVSQVLPVVVAMLTVPKGHWFLIQQPEVHLHPKAQAVLGELMHHMTVARKHHYVIETHSDYLVDRFRLALKKKGEPEDAQVLFFEREANGNRCHVLPIDENGQYPKDQPAAFRDFFISEQIQLLGV